MTELAAAVDAVAGAVLRLRARAPGEGEDEDEDEGSDEVVKLRADAAVLAGLAGFPLTPVYREFLRRHSSHDFVDAGLRCGAREAWISAATSVLELTGLYRDSVGWAPHWLVCAIDGDGCYVVDLDAPRGDDCPVLYVPQGSGEVQTIAPSFVAFLRRVARDSVAEPVREDRPLRAPAEAEARREPATRDSRAGYVVPVLIAVVAALLLWSLR